jgi:hypothetical protein
MSGRHRRFLLLCALPLLGAAPASAAPPGQEVVFDEHVVHEPISFVDVFPCLGEEGMDDDEAMITGVESRNVKITAAGVDASGAFIPPFRIHVTFHREATVDPLLAGLPTYATRSRVTFVEHVDDLRQHIVGEGFFRATALDGSGGLTFRDRSRLVVDRHGVVRVDRTVTECRAT